MSQLLAAHVAATWAMVGLIWLVQVVHYPLFRHVGPGASIGYQARHLQWTTWIVAPLMLVEAATGIWLVVAPPAGVAPWMPTAGLGLLLVVWVATALVQVPQHQRLAHGFDALAHRRLGSTNWLRTLCWTARGLPVLAMGMAPPGRWPRTRSSAPIQTSSERTCARRCASLQKPFARGSCRWPARLEVSGR